MKPISKLLILLLAIISFQCANTTDKTSSIISIEGEIQDSNVEAIFLLNHYGDTLSTLNVSTNHEFDIQLDGIEEGYFDLLYGKKTAHLYMEPGDSLEITLSKDDVQITGPAAERNNYLKSKYSSEFYWFSNFYETKQTGEIMVYYRDQYFEKLKQKVLSLNDQSQFIQHELAELEYGFADRLLSNQNYWETHSGLEIPLAKELEWAKEINTEDVYRLNRSKNYISVLAKILISQNHIKESELSAYYNQIQHPIFKTYFLDRLVVPLVSELQLGIGDFEKAKAVETFINDKQPTDSIGHTIFNVYNKHHEAEGKLAKFTYEDNNGQLVSLEDFRGKYVYIDFWATWCTWCIKEFPYLKKLEERFKNDEVEFIGISIDKMEAKEKWKEMIADKKLTNPQLIAPTQGYPEKDEIEDEFMKLVYLNSFYVGIPHYVLIDPDGKIVDTFFYRPSNVEGEKYLAMLLNEI
ncbi:MAG: TlpA disulfide reductase family protein [Bacteroidota bacterium]